MLFEHYHIHYWDMTILEDVILDHVLKKRYQLVLIRLFEVQKKAVIRNRNIDI